MAHSLEIRVPFLDNDLVDFAMTMPLEAKLDNVENLVGMSKNDVEKFRRHLSRTKDGKTVLRKTLARYVPSVVSSRPKQGFSGPDASWFRGESIDYVSDLLLPKKARIYEFLDHTAVSCLINDHLEGRHNRRLLIWSLLYLENWLDIFMRDGRETMP